MTSMTERPTASGIEPYSFEDMLDIQKPFGEKLPIPYPFSCILDTGEFHRPKKST